MKKFLIFLLFLIILGGAALYFGWAKAEVPPGSFGVLRSKTHGIDADVIKDGEFRWIWYKLIPGNAEVLVFTPRAVKRSINASGTLPSGKEYAAMAGMDADFSWEISGEFSFALKPEDFPLLVEKQSLAKETALQDIEENYANNIEEFIRGYLDNLSGDETKAENLAVSLSRPGLQSEVEAAFPGIKDFSSSFRAIRFPDFALYQSVKALNGDYLEGMRLALRDDALLEAETRINQRLRLDSLSLYGELLTKYPVLLQYLALEKETGQLPDLSGASGE